MRTTETIKIVDLDDAYAALEVPHGAPWSAVKRAYYRLVKRYHPDRYQHDPHKVVIATEVLRQLNEAYVRLADHHREG